MWFLSQTLWRALHIQNWNWTPWCWKSSLWPFCMHGSNNSLGHEAPIVSQQTNICRLSYSAEAVVPVKFKFNIHKCFIWRLTFYKWASSAVAWKPSCKPAVSHRSESVCNDGRFNLPQESIVSKCLCEKSPPCHYFFTWTVMHCACLQWTSFQVHGHQSSRIFCLFPLYFSFFLLALLVRCSTCTQKRCKSFETFDYSTTLYFLSQDKWADI